jgi:hypothetical protein
VRASQVLDLGRGLTMRAQMGTSRKTPQRCRGSGGLVGPAAAWNCGARTLMLDGVEVGASNLRWRLRRHSVHTVKAPRTWDPLRRPRIDDRSGQLVCQIFFDELKTRSFDNRAFG